MFEFPIKSFELILKHWGHQKWFEKNQMLRYVVYDCPLLQTREVKSGPYAHRLPAIETLIEFIYGYS